MAPDTGWTTAAGEQRWTVAVHGELDIDTAPRLRRYLGDELTRCAAPEFAVDLTAVAFCDSSGLGALTGGLHDARALGHDFSLVVDDGGRVHRLLTLAGLLDVFSVEHPAAHPASHPAS